MNICALYISRVRYPGKKKNNFQPFGNNNTPTKNAQNSGYLLGEVDGESQRDVPVTVYIVFCLNAAICVCSLYKISKSPILIIVFFFYMYVIVEYIFS